VTVTVIRLGWFYPMRIVLRVDEFGLSHSSCVGRFVHANNFVQNLHEQPKRESNFAYYMQSFSMRFLSLMYVKIVAGCLSEADSGC